MWSSKYCARSSSSIAASSALICWAWVSFLSLGGGAGEVSGGVVVLSGGGLVVLVFLAFARGEVFLGQSLAMCPWRRHLKHRPSLANWACSSGVSFLNCVMVESTSMGTWWGLVLGGLGPVRRKKFGAMAQCGNHFPHLGEINPHGAVFCSPNASWPQNMEFRFPVKSHHV